jgi:hypothetical protein
VGVESKNAMGEWKREFVSLVKKVLDALRPMTAIKKLRKKTKSAVVIAILE